MMRLLEVEAPFACKRLDIPEYVLLASPAQILTKWYVRARNRSSLTGIYLEKYLVYSRHKLWPRTARV